METFFKWQLPSRTEARQAQKAAQAANWREVCREVNARDGFCCRVCGRRTNPHAASMLEKGHHHHIEYRSKGGMDVAENVCLLCPTCHEQVHRGGLRIETATPSGANGALVFFKIDREDNRWFVWKREKAIHEIERD